MPIPFKSRFSLRTAGVVVILAVAAVAVHDERAWRREQQELKATLAAAQSALKAADARERQRDAELRETLTHIAAQKRAVTTPRQALLELPKELPLPAPFVPLPQSVPAPHGNQPQPQPAAVIPAEDLKPLYDFALDCKACRAKLSAAQSDLTDERAKNVAIARERDAALKAAKGGGFWRRTRRAAKWLLIGAAAGAVLAHAR